MITSWASVQINFATTYSCFHCNIYNLTQSANYTFTAKCLAEAKGWATFELRWVSPRYTSHPGHSTLRDPKGHSLMSPSFPTPLTWPTGFWRSSLTHVVNQRKLIEGLYMRPEGIYWYLAQTTHYCALACSDHWISDHFAINAKIRLEKTKSSTKGNIL